MGTSEETAKAEAGRANKYVAAALLSRAMLYAGSIAKYTQYLGFDRVKRLQAPAWREWILEKQMNFSSIAWMPVKLSKQVPMLYIPRGYPDKADELRGPLSWMLHLPKTIFIKDYDITTPGNTRLRHSYDALMSPSARHVIVRGS